MGVSTIADVRDNACEDSAYGKGGQKYMRVRTDASRD
jgi:hypothetical protein